MIVGPVALSEERADRRRLHSLTGVKARLPRASKRRSKDPRRTVDRAAIGLALPVRTRTLPSSYRRVFSFRRHPLRVQRRGITFHHLLLLLEALSTGEPRTPSRSAHAPLLGFVPLQRLQRRAPVYPGDSNLRHVPSLGILTPSTSCFALRLDGLVSSRPTLLGFTRSPPPRSSLLSRLEASGLLALASVPVRRSFERRSSARGPSPGLSPLPWLPGLVARTSSPALA